MHRKTSEGILTETNLFCGLTCISLSIWKQPHFLLAPFYDQEIPLIMGVYVCVRDHCLFIKEATSCAIMPMRNISSKVSLIGPVVYDVIIQSDIKIRRIVCFLMLTDIICFFIF